MRILYTAAWWLALPFAFVYLLWRARRQPEYRRHWRERLGAVSVPNDRPLIWLHAVSVGETRAAAPLIHALRLRYPGHHILLTHATPTGRATGTELFGVALGDALTQAYLPYDLPPLVNRFLARARPHLGILMETEIWPNLSAACRRQGVPLCLVNARLSERSAAGYRRVGALIRPALAGMTRVVAQTEADAARLAALGAGTVRVCGNLKFDVEAPPGHARLAEQFRAIFAGRFVLLAASTREGEEEAILAAFRTGMPEDALLVIVPRHPQRFDAVADCIAGQGLVLARRSRGETVRPTTRVYLGDSLGELAAFYAASDCAFIGGSLQPLGGQNLIEAAAAGCPILIGPHTFNFAAATEAAIAAGAARRVASAGELMTAARELLARPELRAGMAEAGRAFAERHRGATACILEELEGVLDAPIAHCDSRHPRG